MAGQRSIAAGVTWIRRKRIGILVFQHCREGWADSPDRLRRSGHNRNLLYHNDGGGTFSDVSTKSGIVNAKGTYAPGVSTLDFDGDGWIDIYVANDSNPSALYRNNHDRTFTDIGTTAGCAYSQDGKSQPGMGIAIGDYDRNGTMDIFKTNFAGDTSTLYANTGNGLCEDRTFASGIGINTRCRPNAQSDRGERPPMNFRLKAEATRCGAAFDYLLS